MRIGYDAKRLYNNFTGLGNYSRTLVNNLYDDFPEDEYYLYTPKIRKDPLTEAFLKHTAYTTVCHDGLLKSLWRSNGIKRDLHRDKIELFHGLSHEIPFGMQNTGIRSVVTMHDLIYLTYPQMYTRIDRAIYDHKFRYACRHADKIIAISECTKNDIIRFFGTPEEKIEVIYQPTQALFYTMQTEAEARERLKPYHIERPYMLYVGAINARKNLMGILKALTLLHNKFQGELIILGNGHNYKKEAESYIAEHANLKEKVRFISHVDPQTLQAFYQNALMLAYPSFYEGFGLPVVEALLSKTSVITSNCSCLPEAGGPYCYYVDPNSPQNIAEAIVDVMEDKQKRQERIEKGYAYAHEKFNPQRLTRQVHELYRKILG